MLLVRRFSVNRAAQRAGLPVDASSVAVTLPPAHVQLRCPARGDQPHVAHSAEDLRNIVVDVVVVQAK